MMFLCEFYLLAVKFHRKHVYVYLEIDFFQQMARIERTFFENYIWIIPCTFHEMRLHSFHQNEMRWIIRANAGFCITWNLRHTFFKNESNSIVKGTV